MIKNAGPGVGLWCAVLLAACGQARATEPDSLQGVVELDERVLGFELGGRVLDVSVEEAGRVAPGETIARLDSTLDGIARDARVADVDAARAQIALVRAGARREDIRAVGARIDAVRASESLLERNLERQRLLAARGASAAMHTDEIEAQLAGTRAERAALAQQRRALRNGARDEEIAVAEARLAAAEAALRAADERVARSVLRADRPATVLRVHVDPGEVVAPGAPVITVADIDHPYVDVFVPQAHATSVRAGMRATVRIDAEATPFHGRVEHVGRRTEFTPRYLFSERERPNLVLRVRVRVDDPRHALLAGVPAFVVLGGAAR